MTPLEFLAAVLPSPGHGFYCAAELSTTKKEHKYAEDIEALDPAINKWHGADKDVYFALATFEKSGSRLADNAKFVKSLFIDMDGYESKKAAALALNAFLEKTGLAAHPVDSGFGRWHPLLLAAGQRSRHCLLETCCRELQASVQARRHAHRHDGDC